MARIDEAMIRDDGAGVLSIFVGQTDPTPETNGLYVNLRLSAGTTKEQAMEVARAINERLAKVEIIRR